MAAGFLAEFLFLISPYPIAYASLIVSVKDSDIEVCFDPDSIVTRDTDTFEGVFSANFCPDRNACDLLTPSIHFFREIPCI